MLRCALSSRSARWARRAGALAACGVLLGALAGCAAEEHAPPLADWIAKATQPPAGRALVYVYRPSLAGIGIHPALLVNGKAQGFLDARTYFLMDVPPGTVTIAVDTVNPNTIDETVAAGETKYVRVTLAPGRTFQLFPVEVTADEARAALKKCRLVRFIRL